MVQRLIEDKLLADQAKKKGRPNSGKWVPSMFGRCYRAQYWRRIGEPESNPPDLRGLQLFAQGRATHAFIQDFLPKDICEVKVNREDVLGFADIVLDNAVIDIKCCEEFQFKRYWRVPTEKVFEAKKNYFYQVGWYALELSKKDAILRANVYGTFTHTLHSIPTERLKPLIEEELTTLRRYWNNHALPPPEPRAFGGNECNYCPHKDLCEEVNGNGNESTKIL